MRQAVAALTWVQAARYPRERGHRPLNTDR
jgi:hypothetical protein